MEIKEAYITNLVCHHFSMDTTKCLVNNSEMNLTDMDIETLKDFFIRPFAKIKTEYTFMHPVNLSYNIVYQSSLNVLKNKDFIKASQDIFHHLQFVSTVPKIKSGDLFVTKIDDICMDGCYCEAIGIFKIESKKDFIETYIDIKGNMQFAVKKGFAPNKIDKACLIVFTKDIPRCFVIDSSKDSKFWYDNFLGVVPKVNKFTQSNAALKIFQGFISEKVSIEGDLIKGQRVNLINKCVEELEKSDVVEIDKIAEAIFEESGLVDSFSEYRRMFEEKENMTFNASFELDKDAINISKTTRRIKLDETTEIYLMKAGNFIERGYDKQRGLNYYKIFFSKEK